MTTPLDQLNFGPHNDAVQEVITFVQSGKLLSTPFDQQLAETSGYKIKLIHTFEEIDLYRKSMNDCMDDYEPYIKRIDWDDLLRRDVGILVNWGNTTEEFKEIHKLSDFLAPQFEQLWDQFIILMNDLLNQILVNDQLNQIRIKYEAACVAEGLYMICKCLALFGRDNPCMHETLFPIYQAGGYPCGWSGAFPRGQVAVFVPDPSISCRFPQEKKPRVFADLEAWKSAWEEEPELIRSQKPFSSDQPQLWHGISSLEGEYAYAYLEDHIDLVCGFLEEVHKRDLFSLSGDIAGEQLILPKHFLVLLTVRGIEGTYFISSGRQIDTANLVKYITDEYETGGFFFEVSSKNQTVCFYHYDEDGYCDEKLEAGLDGSDEIHFQSDLRTLDIPLKQENLFELVNGCFEYHGLCDLMLNDDALISGPNEQGLSTATFKRMPDLKYEIDILNLD
ncbi:hypothetical protein [uncultured Gimesia sp.]|uniref:hypothetical protein n=1 Tax=uncultured Gimesia sp. TaxID=1678688 RepID=UPI0030DCD2AD|tara:strand:- start:77407 stop:78750 length:1344 start_codon:yes stop_codon:yes gene_type:complete